MKRFLPKWIKSILWKLLSIFRYSIYVRHILAVSKGSYLEFESWINRSFASPAPNYVKRRVLNRLGSKDTWIETGTYLGDTSEFLAARVSRVYSIEPSLELFERARIRFAAFPNVTLINDLSEKALPDLISSLNPSECNDISFWLDGHFSSGITHKGPVETPVLEELTAIKSNIDKFRNISIFIDDVRLFHTRNGEESGYPSLNALTDWANSLGLFWTIEHDIFIAANNNIFAE